jgi:LytS/YehU family sensor histidine kinase
MREFKSGESFFVRLGGFVEGSEFPVIKNGAAFEIPDKSGLGKTGGSTYYAGRIKTSDYFLDYCAVAPNEVLYKELQDFRDYSLTVSFVIAPVILALAVLVINNVYKSEVAARDAKIMSLLAQMNPHFLNNTLEITNWQIRLGNYESAEKMIESLAALFNASMNRDSCAEPLLSAELEYCDAYLYIIKMRYGDKLIIEKNVDSSLLNFRTPALIIQPLLENAIKHGIEGAGGGCVKLSVFRRDNKIYIEVANDGEQLSNERLKSIGKLLSGKEQEGFSMGLRNVNERLKLIYGKKSFIKISSENGITLATICIPISEKQ